jgi:hypothetical protein
VSTSLIPSFPRVGVWLRVSYSVGLMRLSRLGWVFGAWVTTLLFTVSAYADDTPSAPPESKSGATAPSSAGVSGLELDLSSGYVLPIGRFEPGRRISESVAALVPLVADIGYRFNDEWFLGVHGFYAFGVNSKTPEKNCPDCNHNLFRIGLFGQYRYRLTPSARLAVGLGTGVQFFNTTVDQALQKSRSISGLELFELRIATEWLASEGVALGPFIGAAVGTFSTERTRCSATKKTLDGACATAERDTERRLHGAGPQLWLTIGVRAVILP